jgi:hypothetical protein
MSDLEKFLQQAAERMKERQQAAKQPQPQRQNQKQNQQQQQPRTSQPQSKKTQSAPPTSRQPQRKSDQSAYEQEVLEAQVVEESREQGSNRLSTLDTRAKPGTASVSMADERMAEHLHQVFDHSVGSFGNPITQPPVSNVVANEQTNRKIEVETQLQDIHWVTKLLQDPESLRSAFIASEIFQRRF